MEEQKLRMKPTLLLQGRNNTKINMKVWKKKKIGDWVETKKADVLGAQIII